MKFFGTHRWKSALGAAFFLVFAGHAFCAERFMQTGRITSQPIGHYRFCQSHESECAANAPAAAAPKITEFGWNLVKQINSSVNQAIVPMTDEDVYGRDEVWAYPGEAGDCEDFALLKRKELIANGFAEANLLITVVRKLDGEGHAVLTLRSASGDYILDNLDNDVKLWSQTSYRFLKRQASSDAGRWVTIENGGDIIVGAVAQ